MKAKDFYNETKDLVEGNGFTKLTSTGISSDYDSVFDFAEAYYDARKEAESRLETHESDICHGITDCTSVGDTVNLIIETEGTVIKANDKEYLIETNGNTFVIDR